MGPTLLAIGTGLAGFGLGWSAGCLSSRRTRRELRIAAYTDLLTGLLNRTGLEVAHRTLVGRAQRPMRIVVVVVDVDRFKAVNDMHGHAIGDQLLADVGGRLTRVATSLAGVAARIGGDEFVLLASRTGGERDDDLTDQVRRALNGTPYAIAGRVLETTATVGLAAGEAGSPLPSLLEAADRAMYAAKRGELRIADEHRATGAA